MINHISIRDFAIIENTEIDFGAGLNILTGETGAGKSIVIEAVSLALGARADTSFIRSGCEKAVVQLAGEIEGEEIVITREVSSTGKNLCRMNGEIITLSQLNMFCRKLADIHGQYDHQSLLNPEYHINLVDLYQQNEIEPLKNTVSNLYSVLKKARKKLSTLLIDAAENTRKRDFMKFEIDEIHAAQLCSGEDRELEERVTILQNSEKIYRALAEAYEIGKEGTPAAMDFLSKISSSLSEAALYAENFARLNDSFNDLFYQLEDLFHEIRSARDTVTFSQEELNEAISRSELINKLKAKYGFSISDILAYAAETEQKLSDIETIEEEKETLESECTALEKQLANACAVLSGSRKKAAQELQKKIASELQELNFSDNRIEIRFETLSDFTENGLDKAEFLISTNKGEPLKPLSKIASGGEMSRIMLAFKNIIADYDSIPTLIFDEIDTGISGITASIVGQKLKQIAKNHQIICITHLPQIAACGDDNYRIQKESDGNSTKTTVIALNKTEKMHEIARLLGGINITDITLQSAKELIESAE